MQRAVNPQTGEVLFLVNNQWTPPAQVAKNDKGDTAYLVNNQWEIVPGAAQSGLASLAKPEPILSPEEQTMGAVGAAPRENLPRLPGGQAEMRPYEPTFSEQLMELLPGNKARAANEYAARQIAKERGVPVGEIYKDIGGARPMFNPEGRAPIRAGVEAAKITAQELPKVPEATLSTFLKAYRAGDIEAPADAGMVDKAIAAMKPTDAKGKPDPNYDSFQGLGESLGFSVATMVASLTAAAAGEVVAGPVGGVSAGMAASGAMAYRASKDDFLSRVRDKLNGESQKLYGKNISQEDWNKAKQEYNQAAVEYGAWEAIPEAVSNAVFIKAFAAPAKAGRGAEKIGKFMEKVGSQGVEQATETMTALGQNVAERKAGLSDEELTIADAFRQQFIQTLLIGGTMAGGMKAKELGDRFYQNVVEPKVRPGSALAKAIQADIDAVAFNSEANRRAAVQALDPNRAQQEVAAEPGIASLIKRPQVAMPPPPEEPEEPVAPEAQKIAEEIKAPPSASQDTEAMLREALGDIPAGISELTPNLQEAPAAPVEAAPAAPVAAVEAPIEQPASTELIKQVMPKPPLSDKFGTLPVGEYSVEGTFEQDGRKWQVESLSRHDDGLVAQTTDQGEPVRRVFRFEQPVNPKIQELVDLNNQLAKTGKTKETTYDKLNEMFQERASFGGKNVDQLVDQSITYAKEQLAKQKPAKPVVKATPVEEAKPTAVEGVLPDEAFGITGGAAPKPQEFVESKRRVDESVKIVNKMRAKPGSLWSKLTGTLNPGEVIEIFGRKPNLGQRRLQIPAGKGTGSSVVDLVDNGTLDGFLPPDKRHDANNFDSAESAQLIKDAINNKDYLPFDAKMEVEMIFDSVKEAEDLISEYLTLEEQNRELQIAFDEQREIDQEAEIIEPEGEDRAAGTGEREAFELTAPTKDELKAKQDEIDRLSKENERLAKQAEDKAKADEQAAEFTLTGSDREADVAAARGQKDIFAEAPAEEAPKDNKQEIADLRAEQKVLIRQIIKAGLQETPEQEARMGEIDRRINELEGKAPVKPVEKPEVKQRSVEEIKEELEDLQDQAEEELNKDKKKKLASEVYKLQGELAIAEGRAAKAAAEEPAEEPEAPKGTVATPDGAVLRYPLAVSMVGEGYKVLALDDARTYKDKGGEPHRTFEKGPLRIAMTPQRVLFQNRNAVNVAFGNPDQVTLEAIMVDPGKRNQGLATQAMNDVIEAADKNEITLYLEPVPIINIKKNDFGLDRDQLVDFYSKFGFEFQEDSNKVMQRKPSAEVAEEVLPAAEEEVAGELGFEPYTIEGDFTEVAEEQQRLMLEDQTENLSDAQVSTLEKHYGATIDTDEFFTKLREDVTNFIVKGATAVNGKIRAIIRQLANGVLAVGIAFNPQYMSQPINVFMPTDNVRTEEVLAMVPDAATDKMSEPAKRAYAVIYPALQEQMMAKDKLFIMADKPSGRVFVFNPDGSLLLDKKSLFGLAKGDIYVGDNDKPQNRITPAGLFDLKFVDAAKGEAQKRTAGDYDTGTVLAINDPDGTITIMHSVWLKEKDAAQRAAALRNDSPADSRYSFGCINVDAPTYSFLVNNHAKQMDGAALFIVPEAGVDVMSFITGKGAMSEDLARIKIKPVTKEVRTPQKQATQAEAKTKTPGREQQFFSLEKQTSTPAFKKFFGDSKVVDSDGNPMVVYHGTNEDFVQFDPLKDKRQNKLMFFAEDAESSRIYGDNVSAFYLSVQKPFDANKNFPNNIKSWIRQNADQIANDIKNYNNEFGLADRSYFNFTNNTLNVDKYIKAIQTGQWQAIEASPNLINQLKNSGYDGIKFYEDGNTYAVFKPNQIKSAIGNRGTFDESANINMNLGDSLVKLVDQMADDMAEDEKKRSPSYKRQTKALTRQRNEGRLTDEEYQDRMNAAMNEDDERRLSAEPKPRKRGYLHIQNRLNEAVQSGDLTREAFDLANWFMLQNEDLVADLGISIKGKGPAGAGGFYNNLSRIITLIKEGSSDLTATHEILHHLERMMPAKIQQAIRKAWLSQLTKAQKAAKVPAEKLYFDALIDAHFGDNKANLLNVPKEAGNEYAAARSNMEDSGKTTSMELAKQLLLLDFVPIEAYQYFNPSEFWAVNGSRIVLNRYNAVDRGLVNKLKNWLRELGQKMKSIFGLKSDASIIRALDSLAKSDGKFVTDEMLGTGEYLNIKKNVFGGEMPKATWAMKESSVLDDMAQTWQDNFRDLKNIQKIITETVGKIDDRLNAYRKQTVNAGREAERQGDFVKYEVDPLIKEMIAKKVSNKELATYLHNRYAEERNEIINAKNKSPTVKNKGSGISTENARKYMEALPADRAAVLESLAKRIDKIVRGTQDLLVQSGQETQETIDGWRKSSPHYVPLARDESELDFIVQAGSGSLGGYATAGKFGKEAIGSTKTVVNILENVMLQRDRAIRRAESIRIGQALYGMAIQYPNPDFWMAINPDAVKDIDALIAEMEEMGLEPELIANILEQPKTGYVKKGTGPEGEDLREVRYRIDRAYQNAKNVFPVRINGQNRYVLFNPKSKEALRMAAELKQLNPEQLNLFFGVASSFSRWFAAVNTQYNPVFGLVNFWNDTQGALINLSTTPLAGQQTTVMKNVLPALNGIARDIRKERKETVKAPIKTVYGKEIESADWSKLWRLYRDGGGKTAFRDQMVKPKLNMEWKGMMPSFSYTDSHTMLEALEKLEKGPVSKKVEWWANAFSDFNDTLENTIRLSVFKVAYLDNKLPLEEAIEIAKNITVDFNRRGARTKNVRGMYVFFNAALQSNVRIAITLASPAGKAIVKTGLAMGALNALWMFMAGFDDDDPPQFTRNKGFIVPTGDGDYTIWNLPQGWRVIPNTGRLVTEGVLISLGLMKSNKGLAGKITDASGVVFDAINPFGGGTIFQTLAPTFLDPGMALAENKDSFGRPIFKEDQSLKPTPGWQRTRDSASTFSKGLSWLLNYISAGGEEFDKGWLSPTGDQLDYLIGQVAGGFARDVKRSADWAYNTATGEETPSYRKPVISRFAGETKTDAATSARFYDNVTMLARHENVITGRIESGGDVTGYYQKNPMAVYAFSGNEFENEVSSLNKTIRDLQKQPDTPENRNTIKQIKAAKIQMMETLNNLVRKAQ